MAWEDIPSTGLSILYEPNTPIADIIFVHGLQGNPISTWSQRKAAASTPRPTNPIKRSRRKEFFNRLLPRRDDNNDVGIHEGTSDSGKQRRPMVADQVVFWPGDLLPKECPDARILTWGYDTIVTKHLTGAVNKSNVFAQGKNLLYALGRERPLDRPLIFVAHSLGGIIVKEVLGSSFVAEEHELKNVVSSTVAVMFLGTPHRGSQDLAEIGDVARKLASVLMMDTNPAMIDALGLKTSDLERCQESFSMLWRKQEFRVKTFQEARGLTAINLGILNEKVVPDFSSTLGDPREHAETLDANHMEMCRFSGASDPNYCKVAGELRVFYRSVLSAGDSIVVPTEMGEETAELPGDAPTSVVERAYFDSLHFVEMRNRQSALDSPVEGTCRWLQHQDSYKGWLHRTAVTDYHGLLLIKGKPGSGKSTIMKAALGQISAQPKMVGTIVVAFFFNSNGNDLEHNAEGFLRSISSQLFKAGSYFRMVLVNLYPEKVDFLVEAYQRRMPAEDIDFRARWEKEDLKQFLRTALTRPCSQRVILFVDALDECEQKDAKEIAYFLRDLTISANAAGIAFDVCISSRHFGSVTLKECPEITVDRYNREDISKFVQQSFSTAGFPEGQAWDALRNDIVNKSSGVFLWVKLVVQALLEDREQGANRRSLQGRLRQIPEELEDLFVQLLTRPSVSSPEADVTRLRLFQWAILVVEPLRLREWHHILAFIRPTVFASLQAWKDSEFYTEDDEQLERQIRYISKGLLEVKVAALSDIDDVAVIMPDRASLDAGAGSLDFEHGETRIVQTIHQSVTEFFIQKSGFALLGSSIEEGHTTIIKTCLDYISISELDDLVAARIHAVEVDERKHATERVQTQPPTLLRNRGSVASFSSAGSSGLRALYSSGLKPESNDDTAESALSRLNRLSGSQDGERAVEEYRVAAVSKLVDISPSYAATVLGGLETPAVSSSSNGDPQMLEADLVLLFYATNLLFFHAALADEHGADPAKIIDRLRHSDHSLWKRWVHLNEDLDPKTTLTEYCVLQELPSWLNSLINWRDGESLFHLLNIALSQKKNRAAGLIVRRDVEQSCAHHFSPQILLRIIQRRSFDLLGDYTEHVEKMFADGEILRRDWILSLSGSKSLSLHSIACCDESSETLENFKRLSINPKNRSIKVNLHSGSSAWENDQIESNSSHERLVVAVTTLANRGDVAYGFAQDKCRLGKESLTLEDIVLLSEVSLVLYVKALTLFTEAVDVSTKCLVESMPAQTARTISSCVQWCERKSKETLEKINTLIESLQLARDKLPRGHPSRSDSYNPSSDVAPAAVSTVVFLTPGTNVAKIMYEQAVEMSRYAAINEIVQEDLPGCKLAYITSIRLLEMVLYSDEMVVRTDLIDDIVVTEGPSPDLDDNDRQFVSQLLEMVHHRCNMVQKKIDPFAKRRVSEPGRLTNL